MRRTKSVYPIILFIVILGGAGVVISALTQEIIIRSQGTIRYPFIGNPWEIRSFVTFPYSYKFSLIGTGDRYSYDNLVDELINRFGDPESGGAVNTIDVRIYWTGDDSKVPGASSTVPKVYEGASGGESSYNNVAKAITLLHSKGFKVLLGLIKDWGEPPDIPDPETWLKNYKAVVLEVAQFAEENNVEFFHIGWENVAHSTALQDGSLDYLWKDIIQAVRGIYNGLVAYETNWWPSRYWYGLEGATEDWIDGSRTWENTWWRDLDYLAISTYPQLSDNNYDPTVDFLVNAWYNNTADGRSHWNFFDMYQNLSNHYGKKLLINVGYPSCDGANIRPWQPKTTTLDWAEQADCWEAFFRVWSQADFLLGADLEHFTKPWPPVYPDSGWQYQYRSNFGGKDAEAVIKAGLQAVV